MRYLLPFVEISLLHLLGVGHLALNFQEDPEEETLGGFVFRLLGEKPKIGSFIEFQNWLFTVTETENYRILRIKVRPLPKEGAFQAE